MIHKAIYPGTFDPPTLGHADVIARGRRLFDELIVAVGYNPTKNALFSQHERIAMTQRVVEDTLRQAPDDAPVRVIGYAGLTVDCAREVGASAILKGVRNIADLQYEVQQALTNRELANLETVFLAAGQTYAFTSSSLIRQITALGTDLSALASMVPGHVLARLEEKKAADDPVLAKLRAGTALGDE